MSVKKNTSIYLFSNIISQAVPFVLLPILTRFLSPTEYGLIATFMVFTAVAEIFIGIEGHGAVGISFFELRPKELARFTGTTFMILGMTFAIFTAGTAVFLTPIRKLTSLSSGWIFCVPVVALANYVTMTNLTLWQSEKKSFSYGIYLLIQSAMNSVMAVVLVVFMKKGLEGRLFSFIFTTVFFAVISQWILQRRGYLRWEWSKAHASSMLRFSLPLIPHKIAGWGRRSLDKLIVATFIDLKSAGIYSVSLMLAQPISLLVNSYSMAWGPYAYECISSQKNQEVSAQLVKESYIYMLLLAALGAVYAIIAPTLIPWIVDQRFKQAFQFLPLLIIAEVLGGWYRTFAIYIFYEKKTGIISMITLTTAVFHVCLLYFFVRGLGVDGAPLALVCSSALVFVLTAIMSNQIHPMPWMHSLPFVKRVK